jgi:hypothetical protein
MAEPLRKTFEDYLREREQIEKRMNMERLMLEEYQDGYVVEKNLWNKNKWLVT